MWTLSAGGPDWMPITPKTGSLFHAETQLDGFIGELLSFPGGRHDDQVDALVQGMAWMRAQWMPPVKSRIVMNW